MRELLLSLYPTLTILAWAEATDDGERYDVVHHGRRIVADSAHLLFRELVTANGQRQTVLRLAA